MAGGTIADLLGDNADKIARYSIQVGDVHRITLSKKEGITPKGGAVTRDKFFVVLGFDGNGNVIGGVVINSHINNNLPTNITDYMLKIKATEYPFLRYDSFVNCSELKQASIERFNAGSYLGTVSKLTVNTIVATLYEAPLVNIVVLQSFGINKP